jgi:hypothetical protein
MIENSLHESPTSTMPMLKEEREKQKKKIA